MEDDSITKLIERTIYFAPLLATKLIDKVWDACGSTVAFLTLVLCSPLIFIGTALGMLAFVIAIVLMLILSPILVPVSIYRHRAKHK